MFILYIEIDRNYGKNKNINCEWKINWLSFSNFQMSI